MVSGEIWGCTGFTGDSGASRLAFFPLESAVNVILMLVLGKRKVHLRREEAESSQRRNRPSCCPSVRTAATDQSYYGMSQMGSRHHRQD